MGEAPPWGRGLRPLVTDCKTNNEALSGHAQRSFLQSFVQIGQYSGHLSHKKLTNGGKPPAAQGSLRDLWVGGLRPPGGGGFAPSSSLPEPP